MPSPLSWSVLRGVWPDFRPYIDSRFGRYESTCSLRPIVRHEVRVQFFSAISRLFPCGHVSGFRESQVKTVRLTFCTFEIDTSSPARDPKSLDAGDLRTRRKQ